MPQYLIHPKHPIRTFVYIVLALGLVVGGFFTFRASQMSTEGRSKAALTYKTYISWEFEGTDTEGWVVENLTNTKVAGGVLKGIVGGAKAYPKLTHKKVSLDQGNKMFEISIAVTPIVETYTLNVIYAEPTGGLKSKQLVMKGKTDGQMNYLTARFPEIGKLDINSLVLEFVNVKSDSVITIASIKVTDRVGIKPTATPTPSSVVKTKSSLHGDCNGDSLVNAGDISAMALEIKDMLDGGNTNPLQVGGGKFKGALGCDVNYDGIFNAADQVVLPLLFSSNTKSSLPGDCNGDGSVNAGDISAMTLEIKDMFDVGNTNPLEVGKGNFKGALGCDVNYDGKFNIADQTALSLLISSNTKSSLPGDCNGDSVITDADMNMLTKEVFDGTNPLEAGKGSIRGSLGCDANYDGSINAGDISAQTFLEL